MRSSSRSPAKEAAKRTELAERKALLADRLRSAYDTDRTSLLESFLSGGTFTDLLAEMSYYIDVGEQDKALADPDRRRPGDARLAPPDDRRHARPDRRPAPPDGRPEARPRHEPGRSSTRQGRAQASSRSGSPPSSPSRSATTLTLQRNKAAAKRARRQGQRRPEAAPDADQLAHPQADAGRQHPVAVQRHAVLADGRRRHPELRLHRVLVGAAERARARTSTTGIDLVAPYGTPVKASGAGTVVYIGWNYADGADPAWIVIIAHSEGLQTWYAHMQPRYPGGIHAGSSVSRGPGHRLRGQHRPLDRRAPPLGVMFNGDFVNPRLFL